MRKWSDAKKSNTNFWVCSPAGGTYDRAIELSPETPGSTKFVVQRPTLKPVWYDWRVPSRHGVLYYYQQLVLRTAFRDSTPSALIRCWTANASGSMREECICRGLTHSDAAQEMQQVQPITSIPWLGRERSPLLLTALLLPFYAYTPQVGDAARRRHFTVEQVATMLSQEEEYRGLAEFMYDDDDDEAPGTTTAPDLPDDDITDEDASRFAREVASANRNDADARPPAPNVELGEDGIATWYKSVQIDGVERITPIRLKQAQYEHYQNLAGEGTQSAAGHKQLLTFLSGQVRPNPNHEP